MIVRTVEKKDIPEMEALLSYIWADTYASFLPDEVIQSVKGMWKDSTLLQKQIENPGTLFLVAEAENVLVGLSTVVSCEDGTLAMVRLYVHPDHQRKGIGSALLDKSILSFPKAGKIHLEVIKKDVKAVNFYLKHGFLYIEKKKRDIEGTEVDLLVMEKDFSVSHE